MSSLVGYGPSSGSSGSSGSEDERGDVGDDPSECPGSSSASRTRNFLLEPDSGPSDSDSEPDSGELSSSSRLAQIPSAPGAAGLPGLPARPDKLPPPLLHSHADSSVFSNPFKTQAERKLSALQKHVPLTLQSRPSQIGGKRICVLYRKDGKCRFGINCKFAHDSDLQTPAPPTHTHTPSCGEADQIVSVPGSHNLQQGKREEDSGGLVKKRRAGLSNSLIPPKRALKQYSQQRTREQVNTP